MCLASGLRQTADSRVQSMFYQISDLGEFYMRCGRIKSRKPACSILAFLARMGQSIDDRGRGLPEQQIRCGVRARVQTHHWVV
jgi:hypothetical protein